MAKYVKKILDPRGLFTNWISLMLCVMSLSMDPLFLYIPVIKMDKNCMDLDKKLGIVSCVFRSVIDLLYIVFINFQQRPDSYQLRTDISTPRGLLNRSYKGCIDVLAVLPLPQVVIIIILSKSSLSKILEAMNVLKCLLCFQFVPRIIRMYPLFRKATSTRILAQVTWVKAALNLYLYMLFGHLFGAIWYFFAIERQIKCWKKACTVMNQTGCNRHSFNCHKSSGNYKFLNDVCSTKSQNSDFFDFGIFHDALQSGVVLEGSFLQKLIYCYRWGLQSISCFAQNLVPSIYMWENIFTISITICSVVLFIYLLGNMQLYLQSETTRSEEMKLKVREIEQWTTFKKLPENLRRQVKKYQQHVWRETKGVDVENLLNNLPKDLRRNIKRELCLHLLKRVPTFKNLPDQLLNAMCERLKPVLYPGETYIVRKGDPVDEMLFIMRGELLSTRSNGRDRNFSDAWYLKEFSGEELSSWVIDPESSSDQLPISTRTIKTHTKVEAFALMADDLKNVFTQFRLRIHKCNLHSFRYASLRWRSWAACVIQVTWRRYCLKNLEEHKHEDGKWVKNAPVATPYVANELRRRNLKARMPTVLPQKPAYPDFTDEE
ncbi:hypothetical protein Ddye_013969 [Dipteronia dyeriana]|uniref:Cyclic nucleotide-binding domain-containing protein n=1 Tax=Dipteronia dyeriana TaxID=168575 RepID=A0AAD9X7Z4_9ROSI|nr:hypothetical protein Ddye_013969 [Dipteronia dyeriana]